MHHEHVPRLLAVIATAVAAFAVVVFLKTRNQATPAPRPAPMDGLRAPQDDASREIASVASDAMASDAEQTVPVVRAMRLEVADDVAASGETHAAWIASAMALLRAIAASRVSAVGCYAAGCTAVAEFASLDDFHAAVDSWKQSDAYLAWTGGSLVTEPDVHNDGGVIATIVVYPPLPASAPTP